MNEFFSKFETFLFDIIGLMLPGLIFLLFFSAPLLLFNFEAIPIPKQDSSQLLSSLSVLSKTMTEFITSDRNYVVTIILIMSYVIGHLLKVFSIIQYEIGDAIFDKTVNKAVSWFYIGLMVKSIELYRFLFKKNLREAFLFERIQVFFVPLKSTLRKIFVFKPRDYMKENEVLKKKSIEIISQKFNTPLNEDWNYTMYKLSVVLFAQENIKTLSSFFLAKYNLYRSLSFAFLVMYAYFFLFYFVTNDYLTASVQNLKWFILTVLALLWFTFHYKYKRYWTLCGNETLVSFYFYLNKHKLIA